MTQPAHLPTFENRWLISGTLTTTAPLHVGDGTATGRNLCGHDETVEVQRVCLAPVADAPAEAGRPYLPAATLRGVLASRIDRGSDTFWDPLLGHLDPTAENAVGGKLEFHDARWKNDRQPETTSRPDTPPHWSPSLRTAVAPGIAINRMLRSPEHQMLYHVEYVPEGTEFLVELTGQNLSVNEVGAVLALLEEFNHGLAIGKNQSSGWGSVAWIPGTYHQLEATEVTAWLDAGNAGYTNLPEVDEALRAQLSQRATPSSECRSTAASPARRFDITLEFDGFFMVHDPSWRQRRSPGNRRSDGDIPHRCLRRSDKPQEPDLPSTSVRGVLRSRAEMVLRTLGIPACSPGNPCPTVRGTADLENLCTACRLFGGSGWRAPITIGQFRFVAAPAGPRGSPNNQYFQEFVAIDRFTGGAALNAKFSAEPSWKPSFEGFVAVDCSRLEIVDSDLSLLGLLALVFRDLQEGDLTFGWGATKGYGGCTATITGTDEAETWVQTFRDSIALHLNE